MVEVSAEDAATRIEKNKMNKINVGLAQVKWEALRSSSDAATSDSKASKPAKNGIITISSSDEDSEIEAYPNEPKPPTSAPLVSSPDQPLPSVEGADDNK